MLGCIINTQNETIELPTHRIERLKAILASIRPGQGKVATADWHRLLGEIRSMAIDLPGARGLFSLLQEAFRHPEKHRPRIRLSSGVHDVLDDFRLLAADITQRPTRIAELIPTQPSVVGACDAAGSWMGGVFFVPRCDGSILPCWWRGSQLSRICSLQFLNYSS